MGTWRYQYRNVRRGIKKCQNNFYTKDISDINVNADANNIVDIVALLKVATVQNANANNVPTLIRILKKDTTNEKDFKIYGIMVWSL